MASPTEIARLAAMANMLQPRWPAASIQTWLTANHATRPYRDLAVALAWVAADPASRTPKRMDKAGPWWHAASGDEHTTPTPPRLCQVCCRVHNPDQAAEHVRRTVDPITVIEHAMAARNAIRRAEPADEDRP